jgi:uncharacterized membrane protein
MHDCANNKFRVRLSSRQSGNVNKRLNVCSLFAIGHVVVTPFVSNVNGQTGFYLGSSIMLIVCAATIGIVLWIVAHIPFVSTSTNLFLGLVCENSSPRLEL